MAKQKITITLDADVVMRMKLHAVRERTSVSAIIDQLCREYLKGTRANNQKPTT